MSAAKTSQLRARLRTPSERRHDASGTPSLAAGRSSPSLFGPPEQRGRARSADETDDADDDDDTDDTDADDDDDGAVAWEEAVDVHAVRLPREHSGSDDGKSEAPVEDASSTNASPSLRTVGSSALTVLPSLAIAATHMVATLPRSPVATGTRLVRVRERVVKFKRATMPRASRAARASETSRRVRDMCKALVTQREQELKTIGRTRLNADDQLRPRTGASASGKGPSVRAAREYEQARINHIASLKSRNIDTHNVEVSWLLAGRTAEQMYDRLAESALRANAVNSAITKRKYTQGANYQSTYASPPLAFLLSAHLTRLPLCWQAHQLQRWCPPKLERGAPHHHHHATTPRPATLVLPCGQAWAPPQLRSAPTRRSPLRCPRRGCERRVCACATRWAPRPWTRACLRARSPT